AGVNAVAFSADGKRVATASDDGTARVWDVQSGDRLVTLNHDAAVNAVAFSADGAQVATASSDRTARVHWLWSHILAEQLCRRLSRNLTAAEWAKYIQTELTDYSLTCSNLPVHSTVIDEAQKFAEAGNVKEAISLFRRVLKLAKDAEQDLDLDPSTGVLDQNPKAVALKFSAVNIVKEAESLARTGKVDQAISRYQKAIDLNPEIDLNPATEDAMEQDPEAVAKAIAADNFDN
ncbi:MAG: hypothetical protein QNJ46_21575, partial [Leptolyngbyaceae cyanobacterium MO_188.B28]|nr:hypothetical protein [Leptolyngbyaceae cyanobacterium MO_188.B28]